MKPETKERVAFWAASLIELTDMAESNLKDVVTRVGIDTIQGHLGLNRLYYNIGFEIMAEELYTFTGSDQILVMPSRTNEDLAQLGHLIADLVEETSLVDEDAAETLFSVMTWDGIWAWLEANKEYGADAMKKQFLKHFRRRIYRPGAEELLQWLETTNFFDAPASTQGHPVREGGLVEHSVHVYERLRRLYMLEFTNGDVPHPEQDESIAICGLLHDICKIEDDFPYGHGEKSVYIISRFMRLTPEEALAIRWHMGFSDNEFRAGGDAAEKSFRKYPLAVLTHVADLQATYLDGVKGPDRG